MNKFTSNICIGCIGGLYAGVVLVSLVAFLILENEYSGKEILGFYGYAMLVGSLLGGIFSWLCCHVERKFSQTISAQRAKISKIELGLVSAILILCTALIIFSKLG